MFNPFKRIKELENRVTKLELDVSTLQVNLNETKQRLSDSSYALKGVYELIKNTINIASKH